MMPGFSITPRRASAIVPAPVPVAMAAVPDAGHARYVLPLELDDTTWEIGYARCITAVAVGTVIAVAWASLTQIHELTTARGQIVPSGQVRVVQHLEGGIVADILVKEGDQVVAGAPIVRLSPIQAEADLDQMRTRLAGLALRKSRTEALLTGRDLKQDASAGSTAVLAADQRTLFDAILVQKLRERETLASLVEQRRSELAAATRDTESGEQMVTVQRELFAMREKLAQEGFASRRMLLDAQAAMIQAEGALSAARGRFEAGRDALTQAESRLRQAEADARAAWSDELARVSGDYAEASDTLQRYNDRVERLLVRAPVDGTVLQIAPHSAGEVLKPGDAVARIVPAGESLQAEVQVTPDDIAHVRVGDAAELRVSAFDPGIHGKIRGRVIEISPFTLDNDQRRPYYRARIAFDEADTIGGYMPIHPQPGMVVDAQIITGAKSLVRYLLKPIYRGLDSAFSER